MQNNNHTSFISYSKRKIRILFAYLLYYTGILGWIAKIRLNGKCAVLMYHRVLNTFEMSESHSHDAIIISKEIFETQMKFLKKNYNVISLDEFIGMLSGKVPYKEKSCLVTFDDGWKDNFINAYPTMKKLEISGVIFLPTDFINSKNRFWQERMTQLLTLLYKCCQKDNNLKKMALDRIKDPKFSEVMLCGKKRLKSKVSAFIKAQKKKNENEEINKKLIALLDHESKKQINPVDFLNWDEVKTMSNSGIDFGSHGMSHRILIRIETDSSEEISKSKAVIERKLEKEINSFSYPNGNYSDKIIKFIKNCGYTVAFGTERGLVSLNDDPYKLKRININKDMTQNIPLFVGRILDIW